MSRPLYYPLRHPTCLCWFIVFYGLDLNNLPRWLLLAPFPSLFFTFLIIIKYFSFHRRSCIYVFIFCGMGTDFFGRGNLIQEPPMPRFLANSIGGSHRRQRNHPLHILAVARGAVIAGSKTLVADLICKKKFNISFNTYVYIFSGQKSLKMFYFGKYFWGLMSNSVTR